MDLKIEDISEGVIKKFENLITEDTDDCFVSL